MASLQTSDHTQNRISDFSSSRTSSTDVYIRLMEAQRKRDARVDELRREIAERAKGEVEATRKSKSLFVKHPVDRRDVIERLMGLQLERDAKVAAMRLAQEEAKEPHKQLVHKSSGINGRHETSERDVYARLMGLKERRDARVQQMRDEKFQQECPFTPETNKRSRQILLSKRGAGASRVSVFHRLYPCPVEQDRDSLHRSRESRHATKRSPPKAKTLFSTPRSVAQTP